MDVVIKSSVKNKGYVNKYTEEELIALGEDLLVCASEPDVWSISAFTERHQMSVHWLSELERRFPVIKEYGQRARMIIGRKVQKECMTGRPMPWVVKSLLPSLLGNQEEINKSYYEESYNKAIADATGKLQAIKDSAEEGSQGALIMYIDEQIGRLAKTKDDVIDEIKAEKKAKSIKSSENRRKLNLKKKKKAKE